MREADLYTWLTAQKGVGSQTIQAFRQAVRYHSWSWLRLKEWLLKKQARAVKYEELRKICGLEKSGWGRLKWPELFASLCLPHILDEISDFIDNLERREVYYCVWFEDIYPENLKNCSDRPVALFMKSHRLKSFQEVSNCLAQSLAVVGTRKMSSYGQQITRNICRDLAKYKIPVISGLAWGIDAEAHKAVLDYKGLAMAVVAGGLDQGYPPRNQALYKALVAEGAVLAEYPPGGDYTNIGTFPRRNRIIAGLASATLVIEAPTKSGALITARQAQSYSRDVFVVPSDIDRITNSGALNLAVSGSVGIVRTARDLVRQMSWNEKIQEMEKSSQERARKVLYEKCKSEINLGFNQFYNIIGELLKDKDIRAVLVNTLKIDWKKTGKIVMELELENLVYRDKFGQYKWNEKFSYC